MNTSSFKSLRCIRRANGARHKLRNPLDRVLSSAPRIVCCTNFVAVPVRRVQRRKMGTAVRRRSPKVFREFTFGMSVMRDGAAVGASL